MTEQVDNASADVIETSGQGNAVETNAAAVDAVKPSGTIADGNVDDAAAPVEASWPDDWRDRLAGGDEKLLARLKRFASPANVINSWREAEKKLSSGDLKKALPKDATPEQIAEWRKENGLPEKAADYKLELAGIVPSQQDEAVLDQFKEVAHGLNLKPDEASKLAQWYFERQEQAVAQQISADKEFNVQAQVELRQEWGGEYKATLNSINTFLDSSMPKEVKDNLFGARMADGSLLGDNPQVLKWLGQMARDSAPGADLVPSGSYNGGKGVADRIGELESMMRNDPDAYYRGGLDTELLRLYEAREKMTSRAA